jgi:hypothetical protein
MLVAIANKYPASGMGLLAHGGTYRELRLSLRERRCGLRLSGRWEGH